MVSSSMSGGKDYRACRGLQSPRYPPSTCMAVSPLLARTMLRWSFYCIICVDMVSLPLYTELVHPSRPGSALFDHKSTPVQLHCMLALKIHF